MFRRLVATLLIFCLALPLPGQADMVSTADAVNHARILEFVDRDDVQSRLQAYGVSAAEVKARVASLTDREAAQIVMRIDSIPAGGSDAGVLLLVLLVLAVLVVLLMKVVAEGMSVSR
jgi:hypothetical protein